MFHIDMHARIVAHHPYRTCQPWNHGGIRVIDLDGINGDPAESAVVSERIRVLEGRLFEAAQADGIRAHHDNHHGYTVHVDKGNGNEAYFQYRFSDGSCSVWLMPGPPESWPTL